MLDKGTVYISKNADVYDLLDNDDIDKLEQLVKEEKAHKYKKDDFTKAFRSDLVHDLDLLKKVLKDLWTLLLRKTPSLTVLFCRLGKHTILSKKQNGCVYRV